MTDGQDDGLLHVDVCFVVLFVSDVHAPHFPPNLLKALAAPNDLLLRLSAGAKVVLFGAK
jgi:hypothetical protein